MGWDGCLRTNGIGQSRRFRRRHGIGAAHRQESRITPDVTGLRRIVGVPGDIDTPALHRHHIAHPSAGLRMKFFPDVIGSHSFEGYPTDLIRLSGLHRHQLFGVESRCECRVTAGLRQNDHGVRLHHPLDIFRRKVVVMLMGDKDHVTVVGKIRHPKGIEPQHHVAVAADTAVTIDGKAGHKIVHSPYLLQVIRF